MERAAHIAGRAFRLPQRGGVFQREGYGYKTNSKHHSNTVETFGTCCGGDVASVLRVLKGADKVNTAEGLIPLFFNFYNSSSLL